MELLLDWIELVVALALMLAVGVFRLSRPLFGYTAGQKMQQSNFVVFEAYEVHWKYLKSDMERAGWRSTNIEPAHGEANLYRFQKCSSLAEKLGDLINKGMPETANRQEGADLLIKVAEHGIA